MTWTLLHAACESNDGDAIIKLVQEYPEHVLRTDDRGWTPLHILCAAGNPDPEAVQSLLDACPQVAASDQDCHGNTPLHIACSYCPQTGNKHLVRILLDAYPAAASTPNREGLQPLHMACRYSPRNEGVVGLLIEAYPHALRSHIKMGSPVPKRKKDPLLGKEANLHALIEPNARMNVKDSVGRRYQGTSEQVRDGAYPLHMAVRAKASIEVLEILIKAEKDILFRTNKFGETPLHLALKTQPTDEKDEDDDDAAKLLLLRCCPKAVNCPDEKGNLPLHVAAMVGCSVPVAKTLLDISPEAIHQSNRDGLTPMELAVQHRTCSDAVMRLFSISENT